MEADDTGPTLNVCKALLLIDRLLHSYGFTFCKSTKAMEQKISQTYWAEHAGLSGPSGKSRSTEWRVKMLPAAICAKEAASNTFAFKMLLTLKFEVILL